MEGESENMIYFKSIYADEELPSRARLVYFYLWDRANQEGRCWPAINTIARELKLSRSTVKRALRDLEDSGWVERQDRYRDNGSCSSNQYRLCN